MLIERTQGLTPKSFLERYIISNQPVIVTDAMDGWAARTKWTPEGLTRELGDLEVQVYNDLFDLVNVMTLAEYLEENFGRTEEDGPCSEYVRWYSRLKNLDFVWADEAFDRLKGDWKHPYFLPASGYTVPHCPAPQELSATDCLFPYRGLFISGRGARTRLHRDPWSSSAVLCQFHGSKQVVMYAPDQAEHLVDDEGFVDPADPDHERFPRFVQAKPSYEDTLVPGEVLYIPGGWFHDVTSLSDSISVTWNFVHETRGEPLRRYLAENPFDSELEILRFFLSDLVSPEASAGEIVDRLTAVKTLL